MTSSRQLELSCRKICRVASRFDGVRQEFWPYAKPCVSLGDCSLADDMVWATDGCRAFNSSYADHHSQHVSGQSTWNANTP